jgi:hypothetical protein
VVQRPSMVDRFQKLVFFILFTKSYIRWHLVRFHFYLRWYQYAVANDSHSVIFFQKNCYRYHDPKDPFLFTQRLVSMFAVLFAGTQIKLLPLFIFFHFCGIICWYTIYTAASFHFLPFFQKKKLLKYLYQQNSLY